MRPWSLAKGWPGGSASGLRPPHDEVGEILEGKYRNDGSEGWEAEKGRELPEETGTSRALEALVRRMQSRGHRTECVGMESITPSTGLLWRSIAVSLGESTCA